MIKNLIKKSILIITSLLMMISALANNSFNNDDWNSVLDQYVDERGHVDYEALNVSREQFDRYVYAVKTQGPKTNPDLFQTENDKLAYYINAYNALVFEGVLNRGPEEESVWRGLVSGLNFFIRMKVMIDGEQTNLKKLEDKVIREGFKDPRIHAALNCASVSCPRLPQTAFEPDNLDQQLDDAITEFVNDERNVRADHDSKKLYLSKIFDWFDDDFLEYEKTQGNKNPTLVSYINRYRSADNQLPGGYKIETIKYDKGINKQL